jgi:hypothetical protein
VHALLILELAGGDPGTSRYDRVSRNAEVGQDGYAIIPLTAINQVGTYHLVLDHGLLEVSPRPEGEGEGGAGR